MKDRRNEDGSETCPDLEIVVENILFRKKGLVGVQQKSLEVEIVKMRRFDRENVMLGSRLTDIRIHIQINESSLLKTVQLNASVQKSMVV